jgi:hypothetical protein
MVVHLFLTYASSNNAPNSYIASFTQCGPSFLEVLTTISLVSSQDMLASYDSYHAPPLTFLRDYFDSVANLHSRSLLLLFFRIISHYGISYKRSRIIGQEGRLFTTGCPLRSVRQASSNSIIQRLLYILYYASCRPSLDDHYVLRAHDESEGRSPDVTFLNASNYPGPLLIDVSLVQSLPGSQDPSRLLSAREANLYSTILDHHAQRTSASQ